MGNEQMHLRALPMVLIAAAITVGGCGDDDTGSGQPSASKGTDEQQIENVYEAYAEASYSGPPEAICNAMTDHAQQIVGVSESRSCVDLFTQALEDRKGGRASYPKPTLLRATVKGDAAVARVRTGAGSLINLRFAKQDGEWKIDGGA
jgi:ketosteroid isomerase-like protein